MLSTVAMHDRVATPSICTVQAPHCAMPHPNLVPVMPKTSRSTHNNGVSPSTATECGDPLIFMLKAKASPLEEAKKHHGSRPHPCRVHYAAARKGRVYAA